MSNEKPPVRPGEVFKTVMFPGVFGIIDPSQKCAGALRQQPPAWSHDVRRSRNLGTLRIPLGSRKYPGLFAVIDEQDADVVCRFGWSVKYRRADGCYYAQTRAWDEERQRSRPIVMHQVVMGFPGVDVDHKDGDGLNNTRANLRHCTDGQNMRNSVRRRPGKSGYRGVHPHRKFWQMRIRVQNKGYTSAHATPEEAALAYDEAARRLHGEFAILNFPREGEQGIEERRARKVGAAG